MLAFNFMGLEEMVKRRIKKIAAAASVTAFSLFALVFGAYAWFSASVLTSVENDQFEVVRSIQGGDLESVNLIKFEYPVNEVTHKIDYSKGKDGEVRRYTLEDGVFTDELGNTTNTMTTYDPAEKIIYGEKFSLFSTNCAALYEFSIGTEEFGDYTLDISATWESATEKKTERDIFLSDCADFCVFTVSDIATSIGINPSTEKPYYYPDYIEYENPSTDMSELENLYYRLSYQQSIKQADELVHFYPGEGETKQTTIEVASDLELTISQESPACTFYVCVNYAPSQLEEYYKDIYFGDITAIFDYYFEFELSKV